MVEGEGEGEGYVNISTTIQYVRSAVENAGRAVRDAPGGIVP